MRENIKSVGFGDSPIFYKKIASICIKYRKYIGD